MVTDDQILMDLIGQDGDTVLFADSAQLLQFLPQPDPAHGVMGRRENQQFGLGVGKMLVQSVKIHGIFTALVHKLTGRQFSAVIFDGIEEGIINRGEGGDGVTGLGKHLHQPIDGGHDAGRESDPVPLHGVAVLQLLPPLEGLIIAVGDLIIAVSALCRPGGHRLPDTGRGLKIHICHPQGQQAGLPKGLLGAVPLDAVGSVSININEGFVVHNGLLHDFKLLYLFNKLQFVYHFPHLSGGFGIKFHGFPGFGMGEAQPTGE